MENERQGISEGVELSYIGIESPRESMIMDRMRKFLIDIMN